MLCPDNVTVPGDGIANRNIAYGEFARGLADRFDLYVAGGATTTEGSTQAWIGGGGNLRLARFRKVSLSLFSVASVPLTHRDEACQVLLNPALIVSAPLGTQLSLYSGVNSLVPIGDRARGVFTPPSAKVNVPIGVTYAIGAWGLWGEADFGTLRVRWDEQNVLAAGIREHSSSAARPLLVYRIVGNRRLIRRTAATAGLLTILLQPCSTARLAAVEPHTADLASGVPSVTTSDNVAAQPGLTRMAIETPLNGATVPPVFTIAGYAFDPEAVSGSGVDAIAVYAYRDFGSGAPAIALGAATYGIPREDVGHAWRRVHASGFQLSASGSRGQLPHRHVRAQRRDRQLQRTCSSTSW